MKNLKTAMIRNGKKFFHQLKQMNMLTTVEYCKTIGDPVYDVVKGEDIVSTQCKTVDMFISEYTREELSDKVQITDSKAIVLRAELVLLPAVNDTVSYDETEYTIISFIDNPNKPAVELQLRSA